MTALLGITVLLDSIMPAVPEASREVRACAFRVMVQLSCMNAQYVKWRRGNTQVYSALDDTVPNETVPMRPCR